MATSAHPLVFKEGSTSFAVGSGNSCAMVVGLARFGAAAGTGSTSSNGFTGIGSATFTDSSNGFTGAGSATFTDSSNGLTGTGSATTGLTGATFAKE